MSKSMRMPDREWSKNMWARIAALIDGQGQAIAGAIKAVTFNGGNVPPDATGRVTFAESDPTVPAWAKQANPPAETDPTVPAWAKAANKPTYTAAEVGAISTAARGAANGVASLDSTGKVPSSQLPSASMDLSQATGTLAVDHGGTGAYTEMMARENLKVVPFLVITSSEITEVFELIILLTQTAPNTHRGINVYADQNVTYMFTGGKCAGAFSGMFMFDHSTLVSGGATQFTYHFFGMLDYAGAPNYADFVFGKFTNVDNYTVDAVVFKASASQVT